MRRVLCLLASGACCALGASPALCAADSRSCPPCSSGAVALTALLGPAPAAECLRLRGGGPKAKAKAKKDDTAEGDDDGPQEIGGLRPDPEDDKEEEGERMAFHEKKLDMLDRLKSGDLPIDPELAARKKDKDSFEEVR